MLVVPFRFVPTVLFTICYCVGGRSQKWVRRYVGPALFLSSCAILAQVLGSVSWKILVLCIYAPLLTLPYSKNYERGIYASALAAAGLISGICLGHWQLGILQAYMAAGATAFFLLDHPETAVSEEALISLMSVCVIPFMF